MSRTDERTSIIDTTPSQATAQSKNTPATNNLREANEVTPNMPKMLSPQDAPPTTQ